MSNNFKDSVGALWKYTSQKGTPYLSGTIKIGGVDYPIMIFKNDKGDNEKRPDYRVYPSSPKEGQKDPWNLSEPPKESRPRQEEFEDDPVPF